MTLSTGVSEVDELLTTGGMEGMLDTVWLIIAALTFGGVMEASGSLKEWVKLLCILFITTLRWSARPY